MYNKRQCLHMLENDLDSENHEEAAHKDLSGKVPFELRLRILGTCCERE